MSQSLLTFLSLTEVWVGLLGLAAFLALFWVLRGAPVGQSLSPEEDKEAPRGGYRDRVVAAVCVGMLLILAGGYTAVTRGPAWSIPAFVLGFGTVLALVAINQRFRHASPSLRRTVDLSTAALNASLFAGILIVVNVIAFRYGGRAIDMTREGAYSLSSQSVNLAETLKVPVTFTTFFGRSAVASQQFDRVQQLLELYKTANPEKIRVEHLDPFRDLPRYEALIKRVPDAGVTQGGGIVVEYGGGTSPERVVVRNVDLFDAPSPARFNPDVDQFKTNFKGEDAITSALIRLRQGKKPRIFFTTGHGEPPTDETGPGREGLGLWKSRLTGTGSEVATLNLLTEEIPDDASLVIVAGPKNPFKPDEVSRLKAFSDRKGPILMLVGDSESTGLEGFLKEFGIGVGRGFVVEPRRNLRGRVEALVLQVVNAQHPILESLNNQFLLLMRAAPLSIVASNPAVGNNGPPTTATPLLKTSSQSWAEPDSNTRSAEKTESKARGPLTVGVAVTDRPAPGETKVGAPRLVVYSSRTSADNAALELVPYNLDLVMNSVNWLRGRPELMGIEPKEHVSLTLTADPAVRARLVLVPTVMAVLLIITLGVATYLARRD